MIIGIDGNEANILQRVGVGQYAYNLLTELEKIKTTDTFHIFLKNQPLSDMPAQSLRWQYHVFGPSKLWTRFSLPVHLYLSKYKLDFFYSPSHYSPSFSPCPTVPTIHDLGYLSSQKGFTKKDLYQLTSWTKDSIIKAKHIVAVSQFTKDEIIRIYKIDPKNISIVYNGVGEPPITNKPYLSQPYFVDVGTLKPNKNLPFLITAFAKYLSTRALSRQSALAPKLVIAGKKGWLFDEIFETVKKLHLEEQVIFTDYITELEKWNLYKNAIATIIPSTYEGFGIPAIESQKIGTPVIASDIPSLREILKQSALFIDPFNTDSLVRALDEVQNQKLRRILIKFGQKESSKYTWANSAKTLLETFHTI